MEKENFILLCFFFRKFLDLAECHRECQDTVRAYGSPGPEWLSTSGSPNPGHWDGDRMRLSEVKARMDQAELPQDPETGTT